MGSIALLSREAISLALQYAEFDTLVRIEFKTSCPLPVLYIISP